MKPAKSPVESSAADTTRSPPSGSARFRQRLARVFLRVCRFSFPRTVRGDRAFAVVEFLLAHRRFPERRPVRYVDRVFAIRTSGELREPLRRFVSDKEYAKMYIEQRVGARYNIETYQILRSAEDLESFAPKRFPCVVKPTSAAAVFRFCRGPEEVPDRETLRRWLRLDYYREGREQNYRRARQKIMVEEFITEDGRRQAPEYKVFCFRGRPRFLMAALDRFTDRYTCTFYDTGWRRLPMAVRGRPNPETAKPAGLERMLELAARLSAPFDFLRVDFYATASEVRVGELTNCPQRALQVWEPASAQYEIGRFFREDDREGRPADD